MNAKQMYARDGRYRKQQEVESGESGNKRVHETGDL